jgi:putative transposase
MEIHSLSHTSWECTYHIILCPKYRKRIIYGKYREELGSILNKLLQELKIEKLEGHLCADHIHLHLRIAPSISVANAIGALKGKSAIRLHNKFSKKPLKTTGKHFWSR